MATKYELTTQKGIFIVAQESHLFGLSRWILTFNEKRYVLLFFANNHEEAKEIATSPTSTFDLWYYKATEAFNSSLCREKIAFFIEEKLIDEYLHNREKTAVLSNLLPAILDVGVIYSSAVVSQNLIGILTTHDGVRYHLFRERKEDRMMYSMKLNGKSYALALFHDDKESALRVLTNPSFKTPLFTKQIEAGIATKHCLHKYALLLDPEVFLSLDDLSYRTPEHLREFVAYTQPIEQVMIV